MFGFCAWLRISARHGRLQIQGGTNTPVAGFSHRPAAIVRAASHAELMTELKQAAVITH
jgi:hypothetical protein